MIYLASWLFQLLIVLVLISVAKSNRSKCAWDEGSSKSWLTKGIVLVCFVQIADFIREYSTQGEHGLGLLYHVQWFGVYWIALSIYRRRDLRRAIGSRTVDVEGSQQALAAAVGETMPLAPNPEAWGFCPRCGDQLQSGSKFCHRCGKPIPSTG